MFRKFILALIVAIGLSALVTLSVLRARYPRHELKTCFIDAHGLRPGATVRIAGVDVGNVRSVRANPQKKDCPAEVMMDVSTPYELKIPTDSITLIETAGILGERYVAIDISQASGPPIEDYGCLKSKPTQASTADDNFLNALDVDKFLKALDRRVENIKASRTDDNAPKDDLPSPSREKKR